MFKNKNFLDLFWSFSDNLSQQVINFIVGIILARILLPEEFGLVGIITVLLSISSVLIDSGFSSALINKKEVKNIDYDTVFITNILISAILYLILFFSSNWIAVFFKNPEIINLIRVAGINLILIAFASIHRTIITRDLNFRLITIISLISVLISAVAAIYMAYNGYGVYSLIGRVLIGQSITVILFWILNKWKPSFKFSTYSFKSLYAYGSNLLVSNILNALHNNIYYVIIGKFFSPMQLGFYTRATTFRDLASINIASTIKRVSFSTLSKIDDSNKQFTKFNFYSNLTFLITSFTMLFLFFSAKEIILILLSNKWISSVSILQILSFAGVFIAMYNLNLDYLAVIGKTKLYLKIELFSKLLVIPIILIAFYFGLNFFLYAIVVQSIIMFTIVTFHLSKIKKYVLKFQFLLISKFLIMFGVLLLLLSLNIVNISNLYLNAVLKITILMLFFSAFNLKNIKSIKNKKVKPVI